LGDLSLTFSFLEGRKTSEFLATGVCIIYIFGTGAVKSARDAFLDRGVSKFSMPAVTSDVCFPFLVLGATCCQIASTKDIASRAARVPMTSASRIKMLKTLGQGIATMVIFFITLISRGEQFLSDLRLNRAFCSFRDGHCFVPIFFFMWLIKDIMCTLVTNHILIFCRMALVDRLAIVCFVSRTKTTGMAPIVDLGIGLFVTYVPSSKIFMNLIFATFQHQVNS
jgi:hypothetical protein